MVLLAEHPISLLKLPLPVVLPMMLLLPAALLTSRKKNLPPAVLPAALVTTNNPANTPTHPRHSWSCRGLLKSFWQLPVFI